MDVQEIVSKILKHEYIDANSVDPSLSANTLLLLQSYNRIISETTIYDRTLQKQKLISQLQITSSVSQDILQAIGFTFDLKPYIPISSLPVAVEIGPHFVKPKKTVYISRSISISVKEKDELEKTCFRVVSPDYTLMTKAFTPLDVPPTITEIPVESTSFIGREYSIPSSAFPNDGVDESNPLFRLHPYIDRTVHWRRGDLLQSRLNLSFYPE